MTGDIRVGEKKRKKSKTKQLAYKVKREPKFS